MLHTSYKNKILIAGGGCIGDYLKNSLKNQYEIITASRSSGDYIGDLSDQNFVKDLEKKTGAVYGIICCVGGPQKNDCIENLDSKFFETFENNLFAPLNITRFYLEKMKEKNEGCFIYMSSNLTSCITSPEKYLAYTLSKSSLEKMTDILSTNKSSSGIRFNCIIPGFVRTNKYKEIMKNENLIKKTGKIGGYVELSQIHEMVDFILRNKTITGMKARIDNGNYHK